MTHQDERIVPQRHGLYPRMIERTGDADVRLSIQNHLEHLHGIARPETDHHFGILRLVILHHIRQKISADGKGTRDAQRSPSARLEFMDRLSRHGCDAKQLLGVRPEGFSGRRQQQVRSHPLKQRNPERIFERSNARADSRLAHAQSAGRPVKSAVRNHGKKSFQLIDFHGTPGTFVMARAISAGTQAIVEPKLITIFYHIDKYNQFD